MADLEIDDVEQQEDIIAEEKLINEEYKTWKKNSPLLYDVLMSTALDWPTLTAQWLPDKQSLPDKPYANHRLLIGTHTATGENNYIQIAQVQLPKPVTPNPEDYDEEREEIGGYGNAGRKNPSHEMSFTIIQKIDHPGEVNKARYQPQNANIIATMCTDGRVMVWDRTKHSSIPKGHVNPQLELLGHTQEGFGLSWSPHEAGRLATGSEDMTVKMWDINRATQTNKAVQPLQTYNHHSAIVNDVQYHPLHPNLIASVSDDITLQLFDTRDDKPVRVYSGGHQDAINAVSFNPDSEFIVATGSADKTIAIWDVRYPKFKVHALVGHNDSITSLEWSPFERSILGSASYDRRIIFWDLSLVGEEQTPENAEDGPPEMLFMHGGHTNRISDFSWNRNDPWVVCSAAEDNLVQVWRPANAIVGSDDDDLEMDKLEQ